MTDWPKTEALLNGEHYRNQTRRVIEEIRNLKCKQVSSQDNHAEYMVGYLIAFIADRAAKDPAVLFDLEKRKFNILVGLP